MSMSREITKAGESAPAAAKAGNAGESAADHALEFGHAWDYAPSPEAIDHVTIAPRYELFIGGKWRAPKSNKYFDTVSPSTEQHFADGGLISSCRQHERC